MTGNWERNTRGTKEDTRGARSQVRNVFLCFLCSVLVLFVVFSPLAQQNRIANWPTYGGDAHRSGWQATDSSISVDSVKNLQLLWKFKLETRSTGMRPMMPPLIQGRLISYRGFRELGFVATNADIVYAIDADTGTIFWQRHLEYSVREPQVTASSLRCPGGLTATPTLPSPARGAAGGQVAPASPAGSAFIGGAPSVYALSSDGRLHRLNTSTGDDMTQPVSVLPANARALSLNMVNNVIYAVTSHECNDAPNAVWAVDLSADPLKVRSFELKSGSGWGLGGPLVGNDGIVYALAGDGLVALSPRDLQLKQKVALPAKNLSDAINVASPVVFAYKNRDLIVAPCSEGRLCILDPTQVYRTPKLAERDITGSLSSWQDKDGTRWVLASVTGPISPDMKFPLTHGGAPNGFIAAFKVQEQN